MHAVISVQVELPDLGIRVDAVEVVTRLNIELAGHYAGSFIAGRRADSGSLPRNRKGQPMGVGSGTIATQWEVTAASGTAELAFAGNGPYMGGHYRYPVLRLTDLGVDLVSTEGRAGAMISSIVSDAADAAVRS